MFKQSLYLLVIFALIIGCGTKTTEKAYPVVELAMLMDSTGHFVGDTIKVSGTVDHVCEHGGKKMFILGENPKHRIKVTAGKAIGSYKIDMEGSDIMMTAVVEEMRIDEAYLTNWESELQKKAQAEAGEGHSEAEDKENSEDHDNNGEHAEGQGSGEHSGLGKSPEQQNIDKLREDICSAESGYLSFYSLAGLSYEVLP
ncbi:MAG: hypothetical protein U9Q77_12355 [Candidatus Marinimicrobia bacterium]|nr:hypothetical protein [Candidatus Neomarinimicrobiota bacterium]